MCAKGDRPMKPLVEFTKTTLVGGLLIILPIYVAVLLLLKAVKGLLGLLDRSHPRSRPSNSAASPPFCCSW